ncbi:hypothetical protein GCM10012286_61960 [Streptomyces lasiicapitis]|uniref:Uncharacterized protein n=1 Tax=Streptomyces lasiicapitis TaxID=1923961 RepID=A0ABQ2ML90_9ACTN|nr:hypothetical protein GCM10012286_61960 [Streptomyces lasiicapitis]
MNLVLAQVGGDGPADPTGVHARGPTQVRGAGGAVRSREHGAAIIATKRP